MRTIGCDNSSRPQPSGIADDRAEDAGDMAMRDKTPERPHNSFPCAQSSTHPKAAGSYASGLSPELRSLFFQA